MTYPPPLMQVLAHDRYVILEVHYSRDRDLDYGRSLAWIAPELAACTRLVLTEDLTPDSEESWVDFLAEYPEADSEDTYPHRKWSGPITQAEYMRFSYAWGLDPDKSEPNLGILTELGFMPSYSYSWDGMDWNAGGETPIAFVDLRIGPFLYPPQGQWWSNVDAQWSAIYGVQAPLQVADTIRAGTV